MSKNNPSRQRRNYAISAAKSSVYRNKGMPYENGLNPFEDIRCRRIFEKYYNRWVELYSTLDLTCEEMHILFEGANNAKVL